jgi:RNA polymerase sigma-70 factor (ECF subfamily)
LEVTDLELVRSAAGGDQGAFHTLMDRHAKGLFRIALSMTRNRADAEEVLQEAFIGAFRGLKKFDARSSVKTWLVAILMRQAAKGWHRARHSRNSVPIEAGDSEPLTRTSVATSVEQRMDLMQAIEALPDVYRESLVLRELQGLTYEEIAQVLKVPRGTVESRIFRARSELRARLNGYGT